MTELLNRVTQGDCLEVMRKISDNTVDMILCDLPYGTTANAWDSILPYDILWAEYNRIVKDNGAIVLTASQPFSSALVASNIKAFKHEWIWEKERGTGFQVAKYRPMQKHEHVLVFSKNGKRVNYYPIKTPLEKPVKSKSASTHSGSSPLANVGDFEIIYTDRHPLSILEFSRDNSNKIHPTQKPVALFEYLIRTYTQEGEIVLDNCIGSGTTAVAAINTNRQFIGIEREPEYVDIANKRIKDAISAKGGN